MTIRDALRKTIRGGHAYATVLASTTKTATVRTDSGQILAGLRVVGGPLSVGERVVIQWVSGNPTVYATGVAATVETSDASTSQTVLVREGTKDHGSLAGLDDDDHPQYVHLVNARTITAQHNFAPTSSAAPFLLGANARGVVVVGFRADELDNSVVAGAGLTGGGGTDR